LPLVATARLHKRSILSAQIRDEKTDCEHSGPPTERVTTFRVERGSFARSLRERRGRLALDDRRGLVDELVVLEGLEGEVVAARQGLLRKSSKPVVDAAMCMVAASRTASAALAPTRTGRLGGDGHLVLRQRMHARPPGGGRTLRELDGQEVRLRFSLLSADLYSYWID
jgi:hypothetical protein